MNEERKVSNPYNKKRGSRKNIIKAIVTVVIVALLITCVVIYINRNDANAQLDSLKSSIEHNNPSELSEILSNNDREMSNNEAKRLINYFKQEENELSLKAAIKKAKNNIKSNNSESKLGVVNDKNGKPVLEFTRNGKKMLFIDKVSIKPFYRTVYIKEADNPATYNIDKNHQVAVNENQVNELGSFVVGDYDLDVKKEFKQGAVRGTVDGKLHINTNKLNDNGKILAEQSFNQTKVKIALHNDDKVEKKNRKIKINGETMDLNTDKTYGYFPNDNSFKVQAVGSVNGKRFKTNTVNVLQGVSNNSTQVVNLSFNQDEIKKEMEKSNKQKKKASRFIKEYMKSLNKAYKNTDYDEIKNYIKENSEADEFMKPKFSTKKDIKYTDVNVENVEDDGELLTITISKKFEDNTIRTQYKVQSGKIIEIQDI